MTGTIKALLLATTCLVALPGIARAADANIPRKAPPAPVQYWDGLYAGVQAGYFWANSSGTLTDVTGNNPVPWSIPLDNGLAGFHAGYDHRIGPVVVGVEADIEAAHHKGSVTLPSGTFRFGPGFPTTLFDSSLNWLASVRGRVGLPFGKTLVYGTGGFAMGDVVTHYFPGGFPFSFGTVTSVRPGWTVGGGVEHAFAPEWTARLEYRYTELEATSFFSTPSDAADRNKFNLHAVRAGLSWRPGGGLGSGRSPPSTLFTAAPSRNWTGLYAGLHAGGVWDKTSGNLFGFPEQTFGTFVPPATASLNANGILGGVHAGYNYQLGQFVVGLEQDVSLTNLRSSASLASGVGVDPAAVRESWTLDWLASSRARVGYAPNNQWLLYATGGIAYGRATASTGVVFPAQSYAGDRFETRVGWIAGLGAEYALNDRWSVRAEYLHYDLGGMNVIGLQAFPNPPFQTQAQFGWAGDIVRAGVDYKFGAPIAAPATPPFPTKAPLLTKAAPIVSSIEVTIGGRYWYSTGRSQKNLLAAPLDGEIPASRLTYAGLTAHSAETFARIAHRSGLFVKGYAGLGAMPNGKQNDEDFPPLLVPYSNGESTIRNSKIAYLSADVGYDFLRTPAYRLGVFAGYHYDHEKMNEYGCRQTATFPVCLTTPPPQSNAVLNITDDNHWHSVRLGLNGSVRLTDRLSLTGDAAWLPYTRLDATDTHWGRLSPIGATNFAGPIPEEGTGHKGYQLEAILDYKVTDAFSVGAGGRYWRMETAGKMHFDGVAVANGTAQTLFYTLDRYGGFVQGSYKF